MGDGRPKAVVVALVFLLVPGCSGSFELGRSRVVQAPPGGEVVEPNGDVVLGPQPQPSPIDTVITGLSQAQQVRTLTRQLSR